MTFPNVARFVFWRGDGYVPFWASRYNTGLCYEWAETTPTPEAFRDSVEPLMDKELRHSRVKILESSTSLVHVRWSCQTCDCSYRVFGDSAEGDSSLYPDGFRTRELTLKIKPSAEYELVEQSRGQAHSERGPIIRQYAAVNLTNVSLVEIPLLGEKGFPSEAA